MENTESRAPRNTVTAAQGIRASDLQPRRLRIAVLGPGEHPLGMAKRKEIRDVLREDGHCALFPEDHVDLERLDRTGVDQERDLLEQDDVHLVIALVTEGSIGVVAELTDFRHAPAIMDKAAVLFPTKYYNPTGNIASNIAEDYIIKFPYTDQQLEDCQVVRECRHWAYSMAVGRWPGAEPHSF